MKATTKKWMSANTVFDTGFKFNCSALQTLDCCSTSSQETLCVVIIFTFEERFPVSIHPLSAGRAENQAMMDLSWQ